MAEHRVCSLEEIPDGRSRRVKVGKWDISVFRIDEDVYAIKDTCPHQDVSLSTGTIDGTVLTCPGHVWKFDLRDGQCVDGDTEIRAKTFPTAVRDGEVYVDV